MKINKVELTCEEMNMALSSFLCMYGMQVKVVDISSIGYPIKGWKLNLEMKIFPECEPKEEEQPSILSNTNIPKEEIKNL